MFEGASSLSGEAQVDKMAEANRQLTRGFVSDLRSLEKTLKELREKRVEAAAFAGDESVRLAAKVAAKDAGKADADAKVADWRCQYCKSTNKHNHTSCSSCGAPRAGKKKNAKAK